MSLVAPITIYTDGACSGNPGPGGWGWVCLGGGEIREGYGGAPATTNNRMELQAAVDALEQVAARIASGEMRPAPIKVHTDSQYVKNGMSTWLTAWKRNGWRTASKDPVKNRDLWEILDGLTQKTGAAYVWVKGHAGEVWNERCDVLARQGVTENQR
ncbi:MAG: ribonuclease HI [Spirochaetes bacterium GWD1_61_31]|nr:MAG: ribonuclease HI [Spirochaetes bacterium GWB1_60_80]OHD33106.1 MAG: ribonuclease HI [Spirochaetes bacterium GWC1_61_12]OHD39570.1 MAG: ribonuclease HI [Spirochaetes bacterium GWD1_61_31]OHD43854.1 MAG: ribonuclease HI [Spirochaetes bacterium GWE1_60_18]OHD61158.1 MAG: ribonuclease HI [Spirochaetes bacterium GWF1_60_12]HAP44287.1 ribonuclease HI [Spirochaetaceae bacterium]